MRFSFRNELFFTFLWIFFKYIDGFMAKCLLSRPYLFQPDPIIFQPDPFFYRR
jgi:hypothetical protein